VNAVFTAQIRYRSARSLVWMNAVGCCVILAFAGWASCHGKPRAGYGGFVLGSVYLCFTVVAYFRMRRARERARPAELFSEWAD
jgi:hypothetical protein